jgi:hypothetical protein
MAAAVAGEVASVGVGEVALEVTSTGAGGGMAVVAVEPVSGAEGSGPNGTARGRTICIVGWEELEVKSALERSGRTRSASLATLVCASSGTPGIARHAAREPRESRAMRMAAIM